MGEKVHLSLGTDFAEVSASNPLPTYESYGGAAVQPVMALAQGRSYRAVIKAPVVAATPTDVFSILCPANRIVRVLSMRLHLQSTAATLMDYSVVKRSADNTGGTKSALTAVKDDSADADAAAVVSFYTANPAGLGASLGDVFYQSIATSVLAGAPGVFQLHPLQTQFAAFQTAGFAKPPLLRAGEILAMNLGGVALPAGFACRSADIIWHEQTV